MQQLTSWHDTPADSDFSVYNLPFGIFSTRERTARVGVAIGDDILDLVVLSHKRLIDVPETIVSKDVLNDFIKLGKERTSAIRLQIQNLLIKREAGLKELPEAFVKQAEATMHLPVDVGDYTDFYSSIEHATNVGKMFRDPDNALLPNWKHMPVGYHGRSSSIIASGQEIHRPKGQVLPNDTSLPVNQLTTRLDFELEMAFVVGADTPMGTSITTDKAEEYIFGLVVFNDWSARDIQKWEYVPLGPFLGKSFASSISPWIVTLEALDDFRVEGRSQEPKVLPYLQYEGIKNFDIHLEVGIAPLGVEEKIVSRSNFKYMYWNMAQQLAHHTVNGCNVRVGDMMASGTISGKDETSYGSMLELAWAGTKPLQMKDGSQRVFIQDHDTVTMRARCQNDNRRVGFGEVKTKILPSK